MFLPCAIFLTIIHEGSHYIMGAWFLNFDFVEIHISISAFENGFIIFDVPYDTPNWKLILLCLSGSTGSLIVGLLLFIILYRYKLPENVKLFCYLYCILFLCDLIFYFPMSLFIMQGGDWYEIYSMSPPTTFVYYILILIMVFIFTFYIRRIFNRIDIEWEYI